MSKIKIIIAEDQEIVRHGLVLLLQEFPDIEITGEAANGSEALALLEKNAAHVVLMDVDMPVMNGIQATSLVHEKFPETNVLMLTIRYDADIIRQSIAVGAKGFEFKSALILQLKEAIDTVAKGRLYISEEANRMLLQPQVSAQPDALKLLSTRELEIFKLLAQGNSSPQIAEQHFISRRTVDAHRYNIMQKLNLPNIQALIVFAAKNGMV